MWEGFNIYPDCVYKEYECLIYLYLVLKKYLNGLIPLVPT